MPVKNIRLAASRFLEKLSRGEKVDVTSSMIKVAHAADIAEIISNIPEEEKQIKIFDSLDDEQKGDVFVELPEDLQVEVTQEIDIDRLRRLFDELEPDEAVDLLTLLEPDQQEQLLRPLPKQKQGKLRRLLRYGRESAGGIMTPILIDVNSEMTVRQVQDKMRQYKSDEMILHVYILDEERKLIGTVSLHDLLIAESDAKMADIMEPHPIAVSVHDDQEVVAQTVYKYNLLAVPVVDEENHLLGRITIDDVVEVVHEEANEDVYMMAGMDAEEVHIPSGFTVARMRLPWLLTCLFGSMMTASVINWYQDTLVVSIAFIAFLPAICAMGGNSGLQAATVTIRNLTYGAVFHKNIRKVVRRELLCGTLIGLTCGTVVGIISLLWLGKFIYGCIIGVSMLSTIVFSTCSGFLIPIFFHRIGKDPAISSGPLITTLNDFMSAAVYLGGSSILLRILREWGMM